MRELDFTGVGPSLGGAGRTASVSEYTALVRHNRYADRQISAVVYRLPSNVLSISSATTNHAPSRSDSFLACRSGVQVIR